jgi:hypothetical protein
MEMNPRYVLNHLKEIGAQRPLTDDEKLLGKIAAKMQGKILHEQAIAAARSFHETEKKRLMAIGYTAKEAEEQIAIENFQSLHDRGFGESKRCYRVSQPSGPVYSKCTCETKSSPQLVAAANILLAGSN